MTGVKILRGLAAVAAGLLFCALLPVAVLFYAADTTVLDSRFVRDEIQRTDVPMMVQEALKKQIPADDATGRLVMEIMVRAWDADAQTQLIRVAEGIHDYATGGSDQVDVPINLVGYKARLLKIAKEEMPAMLPLKSSTRSRRSPQANARRLWPACSRNWSQN